MVVLPRRLFVLLTSAALSFAAGDDECCLCGSTCATVTEEDTYLFVEDVGFGTCAELEWHLLTKFTAGEEECSLHQDHFGKACCSTLRQHRGLQWGGGIFVADPGTWAKPTSLASFKTPVSWTKPASQAVYKPPASGSYQNWNAAQQIAQPLSKPKPKPALPKPKPKPALQSVVYNPVQVIHTNPTSTEDLPPIVNTWGDANELSEFDRCMIYEKDNSVSSTYCSICSKPTNFSRGVVVNNVIAGGDIAFHASCGDLNAAFKCMRIGIGHQMCDLTRYAYGNQCGCREFDNNSEEFFGFAPATNNIGTWSAWAPGNRPSN